MKTQQKSIVIVCGVAAVATLGYAGYQLVSLLAPPVAKVAKTADAGQQPKQAAPAQTELPVLSRDPFQELPVAQTVSGPATTGADSQVVLSPSGAPMQGGIGQAPSSPQLPAPQPSEATDQPERSGSDSSSSPNGEQQEQEPPTLALRGVMEAGELQAFVSVHGKRAKPYVVGEEVILGARITKIQPNFIEINVLGKTIRLRVGQEVNFS